MRPSVLDAVAVASALQPDCNADGGSSCVRFISLSSMGKRSFTKRSRASAKFVKTLPKGLNDAFGGSSVRARHRRDTMTGLNALGAPKDA